MAYTLAGEDPDLTAAIEALRLLARADGIEFGLRRPVSRLLQTCSPSTIFGGVWAIIVNAIQRQSGRFRSHVLIEGGEIIAPAVAHRNATFSVARIARVLGIVASPLRVVPRQVRRRMVVVAMRSVSVAGPLALQTSATLRVAAPKMCRSNDSSRSAPTQTGPCNILSRPPIRGSLKNGEPPVHMSSEVNSLHGGIYHPSLLRAP